MKKGLHGGKRRSGEFKYLAEPCPINTLVTKNHEPKVVHTDEGRVRLNGATHSLRIAPSSQIADRGGPHDLCGFIISE